MNDGIGRVVLPLVRVKPGTVAVVERLGRFSRVLGSGWHLLWPLAEEMAYRHHASHKTVSIETPAFTAWTMDSLAISASVRLEGCVVDPVKASYASCNWLHALKSLAHGALRDEIGMCYCINGIDRSKIEDYICRLLSFRSSEMGFRLDAVEISLGLSADDKSVSEKPSRARREAKMMVEEAEMDGRKMIAAAKAEAEASK